MGHPVDWIVFGVEDRVMPKDAFQEVIVEMERSSTHCRRTPLEMCHALLLNDRTEAKLLSLAGGATPLEKKPSGEEE